MYMSSETFYAAATASGTVQQPLFATQGAVMLCGRLYERTAV